MQTFVGACAPERLRVLQKVFDAVWFKVQRGAYRTTEALRDEIARRVAKHANDVDPKPDKIAQAVLNSLTTNPPVDSRPTFLLFDLRRPRVPGTDQQRDPRVLAKTLTREQVAKRIKLSALLGERNPARLKSDAMTKGA